MFLGIPLKDLRSSFIEGLDVHAVEDPDTKRKYTWSQRMLSSSGSEGDKETI